MPNCNGVILWHTVYLLAIVFKQMQIYYNRYTTRTGRPMRYMFRLPSRSLGILLDLI